ncbi:DUF5776 domain-containing protein [Secundilactobacillus folii]|uniref:Leucine-rich repeat protein n=1 Tax=Secundilactobacillus folii TaxID=2678357 RepID=A0A7X2XVV5_9LACO|nr:DUF5776 domain-containing protein [Secundilactobacillus folii]MTV82571.1 leucine-rich repeat protein [Secundilactobacillus folii]
MKTKKLTLHLVVSGFLMGTALTAGIFLRPFNEEVIQAATQEIAPTITLDASNAEVDDSGVLSLKEPQTIMDEFKNGGCLVIPARLDRRIVKTIGQRTFLNANTLKCPGIEKVILPDTVTTIGDGAFAFNQIRQIDLAHVATIGYQAFSQNKLEQIDLTSVQQVGAFAFTDNRITSIHFPTDMTTVSVGENAFGFQFFDKPSDTSTAKMIQVNYTDNLKFATVVQGVGLTITSGTTSLVSDDDFIFSHEFTPADNVVANAQLGQFEGMTDGVAFYRTMLTSKANLGNYTILLGILPVKEVPPVIVPPEENGGDPQLPDPNPGPKPDPNQPDTQIKVKYPYAVYAKRAMRLHGNVNLTKPLHSYKQQPRTKAPSFKVLGVDYSKHGTKRYRVKGGYITANPKFVTNLYYQSNTKNILPLVKKIFGYPRSKLTKSQRMGSYKKGQVLRVRRLVTRGKITRYQLTNGQYVTANKQLVGWTK